MLCPEVWNFKAPESNFSSQKFSTNDSNHLNTVQNFVYNHLVSIVLPDTFKVPESLSQALINDCDYYKIADLKLSEFASKEFVTNFVKSGNLYVLSINSRIDCDNCLAITPSGQLILSLDKFTYQSLGLEGVVSHYHTRTKERYIVTIDLKLSHFKPGKPNYERTKKCLEELNQKFDVIVTWEPPNEEICPSSIAKYFHDLGYKTKLCEIKREIHTLYSIQVPSIDSCDHYDFVEWLGMVAVQANINGGPDQYLSSYETPEPNDTIGQVKFLQWRGFFTTNQIIRLIQQLRNFKNNNNCPWVALYVQGFSDSPIAWHGEEHHYYTNGDNGYTFIFTNDGLVSCIQKCSRKMYCNKQKDKPN